MIKEEDLPILIKLQEALIKTKESDSIGIDFFEKNIAIDLSNSESDFEYFSKLLEKYSIAKIEVCGGRADCIIRTETTSRYKIEDIFNEQQKKAKIQTIESENIELTNESLKYEQTIRDQEQQIRNLTEANLKFQKRERWIKLIYFIIGSILTAVGTFLTYKQIYGTNQNQKQPQQVNIEYEKTKNQK